MLRATRRFIQDRQPHTDFVVGTMPVLPYQRRIHYHEIMDAVQRELRTDAEWRAIMGWRVYDYDRLQDQTRFEPWWWILKTDGSAWDVDPNPEVREYIMDQALIIYRREAFQQHLPIRPPDLYLHRDRWEFDVAGYRHPLTALDRTNLTSRDRDNTIQFTILA